MIDIGNNIKLYISTSKTVIIKVKYNNTEQGIISFDSNDLYIWFDEGKFPSSFETSPMWPEDKSSDRKRLIIKGVDIYE